MAQEAFTKSGHVISNLKISDGLAGFELEGLDIGIFSS